MVKIIGEGLRQVREAAISAQGKDKKGSLLRRAVVGAAVATAAVVAHGVAKEKVPFGTDLLRKTGKVSERLVADFTNAAVAEETNVGEYISDSG